MNREVSATINLFLSRFKTTWERGDARAFAELFTRDASYVTWLGDLLKGREEIAQSHADIFAHGGPGKVRLQAIDTRTLEIGTCVVLTTGGHAEEGLPDLDKMQTFTLVRSGDQWLCAAFQNTAMRERTKSRYNAR